MRGRSGPEDYGTGSRGKNFNKAVGKITKTLLKTRVITAGFDFKQMSHCRCYRG